MSEESRAPDVSVIVPVYNTMPYLTACLESLVAQTLGLDQLEIITVDDGSTDDSAEELSRFSAKFPKSFHVIQQPNSGGPAAPCNRGLDTATGRYVFFLGADDYLGEEALERLVDKADRWGSDVIFGRAEGVGGRLVDQAMFKKTRPDVDFHNSRLAFAVSNTKLFRRSLIEDHGLRYPELRVGSDQPFTIAAMTHASRVSVLADYTYYYGVRRHDDTNISYSSTWDARLRDIGTVMRHVADLIPPGSDRDAVLQRHFAWELAKLLKPDFVALAEDDQQRCARGIGQLVDDFLTDGVSLLLPPNARLRLRLAQKGDLDHLAEVIAYRTHEPRPPMVVDRGRIYGWYPGFRDGRAIRDDWFEITTGNVMGRLRSAARVDVVELVDTTLRLHGDIALTADSADQVRVALTSGSGTTSVPSARRFPRDEPRANDAEQPVELTAAAPGGSTTLRAEIPWKVLLHSDAPSSRVWAVRLQVDAGDWTYDLPVHVEARPLAAHRRLGMRGFRIVVRPDDHGNLYLRRQQISLRSIAGSLRRRTLHTWRRRA